MAQFRSNFTQYQERGGGGGYSPPIHMSTKMQNGKKKLRFQHFGDCLMHWSGLNSDLNHLLKHMFRGKGANLSKIKPTIKRKL